MNLSNIVKTSSLALVAFAFCETNAAFAQYAVTGTTAGGGEIIIGGGSLGPLGPATAPVALSAGGFDNVTLNPGSVAAASGVDTIAFVTSNDILLNGGSVFGAPGTNNGFNAISFTAPNVTGEMVTNNGVALGGAGSGTGAAGVNAIILGAGGPGGNGGMGGSGILFNSSIQTGDITLVNNGAIAGGVGSGTGGAGGGGYFGGGAGGTGGVGGAGVQFVSTGSSISGIVLVNNGSITGGDGSGVGGAGGGAYFGGTDGAIGGTGGDGIGIVSLGTISNVMLTNNGFVTGGNGSGTGGDGGGAYGFGGNGGNGGAGGNGIELNATGNISGISLVNNGTIIGGDASGTGGIGGTSLFIFAGAPGGPGAGGAGIRFASPGNLGDILLVNNGLIAGGNGGTGGDGIDFSAGSAGSSNIVVTNFDRINGGNGTAGGPAGAGIFANTGNATINNWGVISAGSGASLATVSSFPAPAIVVSGNNNTINLNGHSSVAGTIEGANGGTHNVLNLNFTGMSPLEIANLKAQLAAQGWPGSNDFTGAFIVRGVTYYVDPLILNVNVSSYQLQGLTPNQQAIGASLDSALANPAPGTPLFNLFNAIDQSGNVSAALQALSPQQYAVYGDLAIQNSTALVQEIDQRLDNLRDGSENIDTTGIGGGTDKTTSGYSKGGDGKESKEVVQPSAPEKRWGFFATGNGLFFRGNPHDVDGTPARANTAGTVAGLDAKIGDHFVAGALFAYDNADARLGAGDTGSATIESYTGGLYGGWHDGGLYADGLLAYTYNHYDSQRSIVFPGFNALSNGSTHGNQYTANLDGGYDWHVTDRVSVGPLAGVQYVHLDVKGFNETGSTAALAVGSQSMDSLESRVGLHANYHLQAAQNIAFAADLRAAWQHEFMNDSRGISGSFAGASLAPFTIQTASPLRDAADVGLGLNVTFKDRLTLFVNYDLLLWRASYFEQSVNGGFRVSF